MANQLLNDEALDADIIDGLNLTPKKRRDDDPKLRASEARDGEGEEEDKDKEAGDDEEKKAAATSDTRYDEYGNLVRLDSETGEERIVGTGEGVLRSISSSMNVAENLLLNARKKQDQKKKIKVALKEVNE